MGLTRTPLSVVSPEGSQRKLPRLAMVDGIGDLNRKEVGYLSNTKPNVDLLFQTYSGIFRDEYGTSAVHDRKPNAAVGAGPIIRSLSARSHGIVSGMGD